MARPDNSTRRPRWPPQNTFLDKGYQATSTRELTQAMRPDPAQPLQRVWRQAFCCSCWRWMTILNKSLRARIARAASTIRRQRPLRRSLPSVERAVRPQHRGCMLINASLDASSERPGAARRGGRGAGADLRAFSERSVRAAQAAGTLDAGFVPEDVAANLLAVQVGLRVLSRVRPERPLLEAMVRRGAIHAAPASHAPAAGS